MATSPYHRRIAALRAAWTPRHSIVGLVLVVAVATAGTAMARSAGQRSPQGTFHSASPSPTPLSVPTERLLPLPPQPSNAPSDAPSAPDTTPPTTDTTPPAPDTTPPAPTDTTPNTPDTTQPTPNDTSTGQATPAPAPTQAPTTAPPGTDSQTTPAQPAPSSS